MQKSDHLFPRYPTGFSGVLEKRGHIRKNWKERYFTLIPEERVIRYFTNSGQTHIKGEILLDHESTAEVLTPVSEMENHAHVFTISGNQNNTKVTHYISATNDKTMKQWIEAIQETVHDGFPLLFQPKIWDVRFFCTSHMICTFTNLDGTMVRKPADHEVTLSEFHSPPIINFSKPKRDAVGTKEDDGHRYYTIAMFDPDLPSTGFLCWLLMNIKDEDFYSGIPIVQYFSPAPVYEKQHQIYFILLQQDGHYLDPDLLSYKSIFTDRFDFTLKKLISTCPMKSFNNPTRFSPNPIGLTRHNVSWDLNCDELHQRMAYHPPKTNMSPYQRYELLKFCYHHYHLSKSFYYIPSYEVFKSWNSIEIKFRTNHRHFYNVGNSRSNSSSSSSNDNAIRAITASDNDHINPMQLPRSGYSPYKGGYDQSPGLNVNSVLPGQNNHGIHVYNGDIIDEEVILSEPYIFYSFDSNSESNSNAISGNAINGNTSNSVEGYYILVMVSLDHPSRTSPIRAEQYGVGYINWIIANIPNSNISGGEEIIPYIAKQNCYTKSKEGSSSDSDSGGTTSDYCRIFVALYRQSHRLSAAEITSKKIDRERLALLPYLESIGVVYDPVAFIIFITSSIPTSMDSVASTITDHPNRNHGNNPNHNRSLPSNIDWKLPSSLPYNHPNTLSKIKDTNLQSSRSTSPNVSITNFTHKISPLDDVDDMIDEEEYMEYTSPRASMKRNSYNSDFDTNTKVVDSSMARLMLSHSTSDRDYDVSDYLFDESDELTDMEMHYQKIFLYGEIVRKKFSKDYISKNRFIWLDPKRQTLNWGKSVEDKKNPDVYKSIDIRSSNVTGVTLIQSLSKCIHIDFNSGSSLDIEVYCGTGENIDVKRDALIKLINKIRTHVIRAVSIFDTQLPSIKINSTSSSK